MTQAPRALARRYARALLEVASVEGSRAVLALRDELRDFVPQLTGHAQLRLALAHRMVTILLAATLFGGALYLATRIGGGFMPELNEGDLMYMPITDPAISIDEALRVMQTQDRTLKSFPEVEWVVGKAGRADTSTDPAPVNMNETVVHLKPPDRWRPGMTREKLIAEMDAKLAMPGVQNIWTQPIINRIEMLTTGIRTQIGVKIFGSDLNELERLSREVAAVLRDVPGAANVSPEPLTGAPYIDIKIDRQAAARYGVDVKAIQDVIGAGVGETNLTVTIEGRKRFPARVRYTGVSVTFNVAGVLGGALTPIAAVWLAAQAGGLIWVGLYLAGLASLSLIGLLALRRHG